MTEILSLLVNDGKNIEAAVKILTEELYVTGYPLLPKYDKHKIVDSLLIPLINVTWTLIKHRKKYVNDCRETENNRGILEQKILFLQKKISDLEYNYNSLKSENKKKFNELQMIKTSKEQSLQDLSNSKSMIQKLQKLLQTRNDEYYNKIRQKEFEIVELQKTIAQKIDVRRNNKHPSFSCGTLDANNMDQDLLAQIKMEHFKELESLYKVSIYKLENSVQTLVQENINLRNSLELLTRRLNKLHQHVKMYQHSDNVQDDNTAQSTNGEVTSAEEYDIPRHLFHVPSDNLIDVVEKHVDDVIDKIKSVVNLCEH